jgi:hypothetical protein
MKRPVWKPFQIPGRDPDLGWRLTERRVSNKERQYSDQNPLHLLLVFITL